MGIRGEGWIERSRVIQVMNKFLRRVSVKVPSGRDFGGQTLSIGENLIKGPRDPNDPILVTSVLTLEDKRTDRGDVWYTNNR